MPDPFPLEPALWTVTAPPAPPTPPLLEDTSADVCIVGGGYAGFSTALHLAERAVDTVVLEAYEPGWGASGRNGGQVIPGLKWDPHELETMFPGEPGERLVKFAAGTADVVFDLITRHKMEVPLVRRGWIQGAHTPAGIDIVKKRADDWAKRGVAGARALDRAETAGLVGAETYLAGWIDPRGGVIQPLSYLRGLVRAALAAGARAHSQSPAKRMTRMNGRWQITTAQGTTVTADRVIVCTNGYSGDLVPNLERTIIAPNSYQIATQPLSHNVARSILPEGHCVSDTRQLLFYYRLDHENRLIMGGRGPLREPRSAADWAHLEGVATQLFPQIAGVPIAHRWCGRVAVTRDFLPHLHEPEPGLLIDIGCMGRGVGLQSAVGIALAGYVATGRTECLPLPLAPVTPLPLHRLHKYYVGAIIAWHRLRDGGLT